MALHDDVREIDVIFHWFEFYAEGGTMPATAIPVSGNIWLPIACRANRRFRFTNTGLCDVDVGAHLFNGPAGTVDVRIPVGQTGYNEGDSFEARPIAGPAGNSTTLEYEPLD